MDINSTFETSTTSVGLVSIDPGFVEEITLFLVVSLTEKSAGLWIFQIQWGLGLEKQERIN